MNQYDPDSVSNPLETIAEMLQEKGKTLKKFPKIKAILAKHFSQITDQDLQYLAKIVGGEPDFWRNRIKNHQTAEIRSQCLAKKLPTIITIREKMVAIGNGRYPYDCVARDRHPDAMIYEGDQVWLSEYSEVFDGRDKNMDIF